MKHYHFAFYVSAKPRTHALARALAEGAKRHGDTVSLVSQENAAVIDNVDGGAVLGIARTQKRLFHDYLQAGKHFLLFDKGYIDRDHYLRVSVDAWQPLAYLQRFVRPSDRLDVLLEKKQIALRPRRESLASDEILIAGTCQSHNNFHNIGNVSKYYQAVANKIASYTNRPIAYRPNPSWYSKHNSEFRLLKNTRLSSPATNFLDELNRTHLLVTHGSSAAFTALARGIPIMVLGNGIGRPMALSEGDWDQVNKPYFPSDEERHQFLCDVAYCQWTHEEYRSGVAWEVLRSTLHSLETDERPTSVFDVITQYRTMHQEPKYFRGFTTLKYFREIGSGLIRNECNTLLDYGSGKGQQYDKPYHLDETWKVAVTCYDPAVEEFATLPSNTFDAVICCDVMEHVPEHAVQATLAEIISKASKYVFFSIATSLAGKSLPDGRNCHLTVRSEEWWREQIKIAARGSEAEIELAIIPPNLPFDPDDIWDEDDDD